MTTISEQLRADFETWWKNRQPAVSIKEDAFAAYQAGRAALQSQHDEETKNLRDALWIAERKIEDLQSQDQKDALIVAMQEAVDLLGPNAPSCCGCEYEWNHALRVLREAIDHARRVEGGGE